MSLFLPNHAANGGGPLRLPSVRLVAAVAELGSLGGVTDCRWSCQTMHERQFQSRERIYSD
jgi:hypothetical protein